MEHRGTVELTTQRLILRRFIIDDAENMYKNWANDDEVTKYLTWKTHKNISVSKNVLEEWVNNYCGDNFYLGIALGKNTGTKE